MRILSVDGDKTATHFIVEGLSVEGFKVSVTDSGEEAIDLAKIYDYDALLIDLTLPDMPGLHVIRTLRAANNHTPIIVLSARAETADKSGALMTGADDYLTKPYHNDELIARIRAVVRRAKGHARSTIEIGDLTVDIENRIAKVGETRINLTTKEYQLLELMAIRKGSTISKERFLTYLYDGRDEPEIKIIDVFLCKIRKKLRALGADYIETVWGRGYVLRDPAASSPSIVPELSAMVENPPWSVPNLIEQDRVKSPPLAPQ